MASAADYLRFAQMLLNDGRLGNARLLAPLTVKSDDLGCAAAGIRLCRLSGAVRRYRADAGDGPGFRPRLCGSHGAEGHNPLPGSVGTFYWTGAWGTTFWVDPKEQFVIT